MASSAPGPIRSRARAKASSRSRLPLRGSMPPTASTVGRSAPSHASARRPPGRAGAPAKRAPSTPFAITPALTPCSRSTHVRPVATDADAVVHVLDRRPLTLGQHRAGEVVDVMDRAHDGRHAALGAQRKQRPRRQAVLGVVDVRRAGVAHPRRQRRPRSAGCAARRPRRDGGPPAPAAPAPAVSRKKVAPSADSAHSSTSCPRSRERLGQAQGVHHSAAGFGGVGGEADPHPRAGLILRWRRRAVRRRRWWAPAGHRRPRAPLAGTLSTWGSASVPST